MEKKKFSKKAWSAEEDQLLVELISDIGPRSWERISQQVQERTGKQCRERWSN